MTKSPCPWRIALLGLDDSILELAWRCCRVNFEIAGIYHKPHEEALKGALRLGCSAYATPELMLKDCNLVFKSRHAQLPSASTDANFWIEPADRSSNDSERCAQFYQDLEIAEQALPTRS